MQHLWGLISSDNNRTWNKKPHVFAVFLELDADGTRQREFCISWLPESGDYSVLSGPVPGKNWDLKQTLSMTPPESRPVLIWGFQRVRAEFFENAWQLKKDLDRGRYKYKVVDWLRKDCRNCTSVLAELDPCKSFNVGLKAGHHAGKQLWNFYQDHVISTNAVYPIEEYFEEFKELEFWKKV
jgi:hypothetical protein